MTTVGIHDAVCALCGAASKHQCLNSTNAFGPPDLDLRPPPMQRSTIRLWVEECPRCGYIADDIEEADDVARAAWSKGVPEGDALLARASGLVARFLRLSLVEERSEQAEEAAQHALWAAWVADDEGNALATELRCRAADILLGVRADWGDDEDGATQQLRLVDVLRRAERWTEAIAMAEGLLKRQSLDDTMRSIAAFQTACAAARDAACYTIDEALAVPQ